MGALLTALSMTNSATSKPPVLLLGDRDTVNAIVAEVNLPDDRRGLVHVILEDARVKAERLDSPILPISASAEPLVELPADKFSLEQLDVETRSELVEVLDEDQMSELHRAIEVVLASTETVSVD
jgi:ATP phosphoribosyltransferase regulatory subunit HisZ